MPMIETTTYRDVDNGVGILERFGETVPGDDIDAGRPRYRDDLVPRGTEHIDDMTPELPGGAGHDDLRLLHDCLLW